MRNGADLLEAMGIEVPKKLVASELSDMEIAQLRFTTVSDEESDEIIAELDRRRKLWETKEESPNSVDERNLSFTLFR